MSILTFENDGPLLLASNYWHDRFGSVLVLKFRGNPIGATQWLLGSHLKIVDRFTFLARLDKDIEKTGPAGRPHII